MARTVRVQPFSRLAPYTKSNTEWRDGHCWRVGGIQFQSDSVHCWGLGASARKSAAPRRNCSAARFRAPKCRLRGPVAPLPLWAHINKQTGIATSSTAITLCQLAKQGLVCLQLSNQLTQDSRRPSKTSSIAIHNLLLPLQSNWNWISIVWCIELYTTPSHPETIRNTLLIATLRRRPHIFAHIAHIVLHHCCATIELLRFTFWLQRTRS